MKLVRGNEAVIYGALLAGCQSYYGYPITPASEIAHTAAYYFPQLGRTFLQAESELAAINMVYGASAAGERTMTASSGPGISLKSEGLSYLAGAELPAVVVNVMRAGPGLGNIGPEQSDYNQMVKGGGHGNYRLIVLAPYSAQEMCDMTILAFELADRYRTPVAVLADGVIGQMMEAVRFPKPCDTSPAKPWAVRGDAATRPNCLTSIYLDFDSLEAHNRRLIMKFAEIEAREQRWQGYMLDDAEVAIVAYGVTSREAKSVCESLRADGIKAGLFRPKTLWPFPKEGLCEIAERVPKIFVAELSMGMLIDDVRLALNDGRRLGFAANYGGKLIRGDALRNAVVEFVKGQQ
ncbi:MAG: 3-methyl-2-oxobutanoate dehydrogenase subunit VorB [Spirochaetota bacterium]|jgi:pyruvate/2-oxoacid:ferredoxin oxidoreductase alpha subunit|nr:3-methyl-2-oxobutanoate dehydrogenase subunit VorB [Spirochaetota bacterium]